MRHKRCSDLIQLDSLRLLTYDVESGLAVVLDGFYGLLVDITLVLDSRSKGWAHERMTTIMAIGDLEETDVSRTRRSSVQRFATIQRNHPDAKLDPAIILPPSR